MSLNIVGTPLPTRSGGGGFSLQPNFKNGRAWQDLNFWRGFTGKEGGDFFEGRGVAIFL